MALTATARTDTDGSGGSSTAVGGASTTASSTVSSAGSVVSPPSQPVRMTSSSSPTPPPPSPSQAVANMWRAGESKEEDKKTIPAKHEKKDTPSTPQSKPEQIATYILNKFRETQPNDIAHALDLLIKDEPQKLREGWEAFARTQVQYNFLIAYYLDSRELEKKENAGFLTHMAALVELTNRSRSIPPALFNAVKIKVFLAQGKYAEALALMKQSSLHLNLVGAFFPRKMKFEGIAVFNANLFQAILPDDLSGVNLQYTTIIGAKTRYISQVEGDHWDEVINTLSAVHGGLNVVYCVDEDDLFNRSRRGWTLAHFVARSGRTEAVAKLIEKQARLNQKNAFGEKPYHVALRHNHMPAVMGLLQAEGVTVDKQDLETIKNYVEQLNAEAAAWLGYGLLLGGVAVGLVIAGTLPALLVVGVCVSAIGLAARRIYRGRKICELADLKMLATCTNEKSGLFYAIARCSNPSDLKPLIDHKVDLNQTKREGRDKPYHVALKAHHLSVAFCLLQADGVTVDSGDMEKINEALKWPKRRYYALGLLGIATVLTAGVLGILGILTALPASLMIAAGLGLAFWSRAQLSAINEIHMLAAAKFRDEFNIFQMAAQCNNVETIKIFVQGQQDLDLNNCNRQREKPFHVALRSGHLSVAIHLLDKQEVIISEIDMEKMDTMHKKNWGIASFGLLLSGLGVGLAIAGTISVFPAVLIAGIGLGIIYKGITRIQAVNQVRQLAYGKMLAACTNEESGLFNVIARCSNPADAQKLIERKVDLNQRNTQQEKPFHVALKLGHLSVAMRLLQPATVIVERKDMDKINDTLTCFKRKKWGLVTAGVVFALAAGAYLIKALIAGLAFMSAAFFIAAAIIAAGVYLAWRSYSQINAANEVCAAAKQKSSSAPGFFQKTAEIRVNRGESSSTFRFKPGSATVTTA